MRREIIELREVIQKLVPLLTGKGLEVTQRGSKAYVKTDPATKRPISVNIPNISDNASDGLISAIQGFIDHEVAHVLITDWHFYGGGPAPEELHLPEVQKLLHCHNIVEDTMIEREIVKIFPGSKKNIANLRDHFIAKITKPAIQQEKDPKKIFGYLVVPAMRALAGHPEFEEFMNAEGHWENPMIKDLVSSFKPESIDRLKTVETTEQTLELARELFDILYKKPPEQESEPDASDPSESDEKQDSTDQQSSEEQSENGEDGSEEDGSGSDQSDENQEEANDDSKSESGSGDEAEEDGSDAQEPDETDDGEKEAEDASKSSDNDDTEDGPDDDDGDDSGDTDGSEPDADPDEDTGQSGGEEDGEEPGSSSEHSDDGDDEQSGEDENSDDPEGDADGDDGSSESDDSPDGDADEQEQQPTDAGVDQNEPSGDIDGNDEEAEGDNGVGSEEAKSMFDFDEDILEGQDISEAVADLISQEAVEAIRHSDWSVFTRDYDRIEHLEVPKIPQKWIPDMEESVRSMTGRMQKDIERIMASQSHVVNQPGHKKGRLHAASLYRVTMGDPRVFTQRQEHKSKDTAVMLLVDNSGSMSGSKMRAAMQASYALSATLDRVNIAHEMIGFTTGSYYDFKDLSLGEEYEKEIEHSNIDYDRVIPLVMPIYKDFTERLDATVKSRVAYAMNAQKGLNGNIDGESLMIAAERLARRPEKRKVMLVLSDGMPAGGSKSLPHLRGTIEYLEASGIETVGIGIMSDAVQRFYKNHVVLNNVEDLPGQVMGEIKKILA